MQVVVADIAVLVLGVRAASIDEYPVSTSSAGCTCALVVVDVIVDYRERGVVLVPSANQQTWMPWVTESPLLNPL